VAQEFAEKQAAMAKQKGKKITSELAEEIAKRKQSPRMVGGAAFEAVEEGGKKVLKGLGKGLGRGAMKGLAVIGSLPATAAMELLRSEDVAAAEIPAEEMASRDAFNKLIKEEALKKYAGGGCAGRDKEYEEGGIPVEGYDSDLDEELIDGTSYVGDRVDAKVNSGEMVLNVEQQQRLMDLLRGDIIPEEMPDEDIVRPAEEDETNLHEKNEELEARIASLEEMLKGM
jgi:uncharacterized protein (UPF0147 family)